MVGPLDPTGLVAPHPVKVLGARYRSAAFCGRCHQGTYAQWLSAGDPNRPPACQQCHMPPVTRKMTQATSEVSKIFVAAEKAEPQRTHSFTPVPAQAAGAVAAKLVRGARGLELIVQNRMPHALPTGDFGSHRLLLTVEAVAAAAGPDANATSAPAAGAVIDRWELTSAAGKAIPVGQQVRLPLDLPANAKAIRLLLQRPEPQAGLAERMSKAEKAATIFSALIEIPEKQ